MLSAYSNLKSTCYAWLTEKNEAPFFCKKCQKEVTLKKGLIKQHHFAHKPPRTCTFGAGESEIHYRAKRGIFEGLKANKDCSFCELEMPIGGIIPDVYAIIRGQKVAIEIQRSKMTVEEAYNRTISCIKLGYR